MNSSVGTLRANTFPQGIFFHDSGNKTAGYLVPSYHFVAFPARKDLEEAC
jgi:hypothetical protein